MPGWLVSHFVPGTELTLVFELPIPVLGMCSDLLCLPTVPCGNPHGVLDIVKASTGPLWDAEI